MGKHRQNTQEKQHFSHPHTLKLINPSQAEALTCNACEKPNNSNFYGCNGCRYFLHENCLNAPRFLDHASHPSHDLTLLPVPTYSTRSYDCKACGSAGNGFTFSCARCEFDVHLQCALLPQTVLLPQHHHKLELIFDSPFNDDVDESDMFVCDLCRGEVDHDYWLYYCADCDFGTHVECGISKSRKGNPVMIMTPKEGPIPKKETFQEEKEEEVEEKEEEEEEEEEEVDVQDEEEHEYEEEDDEEDQYDEEEDEDEDEDKEEEDEEYEEEKEEKEEEELSVPRSVLIDEHTHELGLLFSPPCEGDNTAFECDICNVIMKEDDWLYYCPDCDFGSHLHCAIPPAARQQQNPNVNAAVEMINSANEAHEQLMAAILEAQISARGRAAALDLI